MALRLRRSSQNQLTQSARLSRLSEATSAGVHLAALQHQHELRVGLAQRLGHAIVEADPAQPVRAARPDSTD